MTAAAFAAGLLLAVLSLIAVARAFRFSDGNLPVRMLGELARFALGVAGAIACFAMAWGRSA